MRMSCVAVLVSCLMLPLATARAQPFVPGCAVPFPSPTPHAVDTQCGNEGGAFNPGEDTPEHRAQNVAKNNVCATGTPSRVTVLTMTKLQQSAVQLQKAGQLQFGSKTVLPTNRSVLHNLRKTSDGNTVGEGSFVQFVGFIQKTKAGSSESVNCGLTGIDDNDIHIVLVEKKTTPECGSITAEMIPHSRPNSWNRTNLNQIKNPVRIKGQLFFDASHKPCGVPGGGSPARVSDWEIHPVYSIDVCSNTTMAKCRFDNDSVWTPLD